MYVGAYETSVKGLVFSNNAFVRHVYHRSLRFLVKNLSYRFCLYFVCKCKLLPQVYSEIFITG